MLPGLEPARLDRRQRGEFERIQGNPCAPLSLTANRDHGLAVGQVEAFEDDVLAENLYLIGPTEQFLQASQPGTGRFIFALGIGERQFDACLDRLALLHFFEKAGHRACADE